MTNVTVSVSPDTAEVREALVRPLRFRYSGPLDLFRTWGRSGPHVYRDPDVVIESNFEAISADMTVRFPRDCAVVYSSHPTVGWCNQLAVRVLADDGAVTEAFRAMLDWRRRLQRKEPSHGTGLLQL